MITLVGNGVVPGIASSLPRFRATERRARCRSGGWRRDRSRPIPLKLRAVGSQAVTVNNARVAENATNEFSLEAVAEATAIAAGTIARADGDVSAGRRRTGHRGVHLRDRCTGLAHGAHSGLR